MLYTRPPSAVHASLPLRPVCCRSRLGGTRRYGAPGPRLRRSADGLADKRAQSSGLRPGERVTLREGLAGFEECVGGGARVEVPGCRSYWCRLGMGAREGTPRREGPVLLRVGGRGGGAMEVFAGASGSGGGEGAEKVGRAEGEVLASTARAMAAAEAGGWGERENEGMLSPLSWTEAVALGVVCGEGEESACEFVAASFG